MRIKKFLAHVTREAGKQLGWIEIELGLQGQDLRIQFENVPGDDITDHNRYSCYSKMSHVDGWYRCDEQGAHLISYGNGSSYVPHGYPSIAGILFCAIGEARSIILPGRKEKKKSRKKRESQPGDILTQDRYQHGILLYGLADGTLMLSDEHPFYPATLPFLQENLEKNCRAIDHALPGVVFPENKDAAKVCEYQYRKTFVPLLANHIVVQIVEVTEGSAIRQEPNLYVISSTQ